MGSIREFQPKKPPTERYKMSDRESKLHSQLMRMVNAAMQSRRRLNAEWALNDAYFHGYQWAYADPLSGQIIPTTHGPSGATQPVANWFRKLVGERAGRYLRKRKSWVTLPASIDPEDEVQSSADTQALLYIERSANAPARMAEIFLDVARLGTGIGKVYWDQNAGQLVSAEKLDSKGRPIGGEPCEACGGTGEQDPFSDMQDVGLSGQFTAVCDVCFGEGTVGETEVRHNGDTRIKAMDPRLVYWQPGAPSTDEAGWCFEISYPTWEEVELIYPNKAQHLTVVDNPADIQTQRMAGISTGFEDVSDSLGRVEIFTLYKRPSLKRPTGSIYRFARNMVLEDRNWPLPRMGWHPFVVYTDFPGRGLHGVYGGCAATDLRNLQSMINHTLAIIHQYGKHSGRPVWVEPAEAQMEEDTSYPLPGRRLRVSGNTPWPPFFAQPKPLPGEFFNTLTVLRGWAVEIMGGRDLPEGADLSGRMIVAIDEIVEKEAAVATELHQEQHARMGRMALTITKEMYTEERSQAVIGRSGALDFATIKPFSSPMDSVDVHVAAGDWLPDSQLGRAEMVKENYAPYLVDDNGMPDYQQILELQRVSSVEVDKSRLYRNGQVRENREMRQTGQPIPVRPLEPHRDHYGECVKELAILDQQGLKDSPAYAAIEQHAMMHQQYMLQAQAAAQQASALQVAGGNTPTPQPSASLPGMQPAVQPTTSAPEQPGGGASAQVHRIDTGLERLTAARLDGGGAGTAQARSGFLPNL